MVWKRCQPNVLEAEWPSHLTLQAAEICQKLAVETQISDRYSHDTAVQLRKWVQTTTRLLFGNVSTELIFVLSKSELEYIKY